MGARPNRRLKRALLAQAAEVGKREEAVPPFRSKHHPTSRRGRAVAALYSVFELFDCYGSKHEALRARAKAAIQVLELAAKDCIRLRSEMDANESFTRDPNLQAAARVLGLTPQQLRRTEEPIATDPGMVRRMEAEGRAAMNKASRVFPDKYYRGEEQGRLKQEVELRKKLEDGDEAKK
jgi:hypothetical protein